MLPTDPRHVPLPHLLEVSHVAHRLSASQEYVRRLIREKKLAAIRLGARWRVDPLDLQAFIDAQRQATAVQQPGPRRVRPADRAIGNDTHAGEP